MGAHQAERWVRFIKNREQTHVILVLQSTMVVRMSILKIQQLGSTPL